MLKLCMVMTGFWYDKMMSSRVLCLQSQISGYKFQIQSLLKGNRFDRSSSASRVIFLLCIIYVAFSYDIVCFFPVHYREDMAIKRACGVDLECTA